MIAIASTIGLRVASAVLQRTVKQSNKSSKCSSCRLFSGFSIARTAPENPTLSASVRIYSGNETSLNSCVGIVSTFVHWIYDSRKRSMSGKEFAAVLLLMQAFTTQQQQFPTPHLINMLVLSITQHKSVPVQQQLRRVLSVIEGVLQCHTFIHFDHESYTIIAAWLIHHCPQHAVDVCEQITALHQQQPQSLQMYLCALQSANNMKLHALNDQLWLSYSNRRQPAAVDAAVFTQHLLSLVARHENDRIESTRLLLLQLRTQHHTATYAMCVQLLLCFQRHPDERVKRESEQLRLVLRRELKLKQHQQLQQTVSSSSSNTDYLKSDLSLSASHLRQWQRWIHFTNKYATEKSSAPATVTQQQLQ